GDASRTFHHWDRFFLPSVAQIEYAVDGWFRLVNTIVHLPMSAFRTRAWFVVRFQSRMPAPVVHAIVRQHGKRILRQDADALARQTERTRDLGGERYASTELDLLGPSIWHLLRHAQRAQAPARGACGGRGAVCGACPSCRPTPVTGNYSTAGPLCWICTPTARGSSRSRSAPCGEASRLVRRRRSGSTRCRRAASMPRLPWR